jgi:hypothetical protein
LLDGPHVSIISSKTYLLYSTLQNTLHVATFP